MKHCLPVTTFSQKTYNIYNTTQYSQTYRAHLYRCLNRIENNKITSNFREETIFDSKSLFVYTGGKAIFAANKDFYRKSWNQFHVIQKHRLKEARDRKRDDVVALYFPWGIQNPRYFMCESWYSSIYITIWTSNSKR